MLAGMGGIAGLAVAYAGTRMLLALAFPGADRLPIHASPSLEVIGFAFGLVAGDGRSVWRGAGVDCGAGQAGRGAAQRDADDGCRSASLLQRGLVVLQAAFRWCCWWARGCFRRA